MGAAIGEILGNAVGVAISPVPIIAVILMLFTARATSNSLAFLSGWLVGLSVAGLVVLAVGLESSQGEESSASGWIKVVIGVLFLGLAVKQWSSRPTGHEEPTMPGWMASIDQFTAPKSFGIGFLLSAVNPKNLGLTIAAMAKVSTSGLSTAEEVGTLVVFVVIASLTVAAPVLLNVILGARAQPTLTTMKDWLAENNSTVMTVLFVVLGAKLLGDGIAVLA